MYHPNTMLLTFDEFEDLRAALPPKEERTSVVRLSPILRLQRIQAAQQRFDQRIRKLPNRQSATAS